jgi:hypothetical protein
MLNVSSADLAVLGGEASDGILASEVPMVLLGRDLSDVLVLTGAGIELNFRPTITHALVTAILCRGGKCITTNLTPIFPLLFSPESALTFVAVHGLITDVVQGRGKRSISHRIRGPISKESGAIDEQYRGSEGNWKGSAVFIPKRVEEHDINLVEARAMAGGASFKVLLILGQSLDKLSNGRGLNWLTNVRSDLGHVVFVNPDETITEDILREKLRGWGLKMNSKMKLTRIHASADAFSKDVINSMTPESRSQVEALWDDSQIKARLDMLELPPVELLGDDHRVGKGQVSLRSIYQNIERLKMEKMNCSK